MALDSLYRLASGGGILPPHSRLTSQVFSRVPPMAKLVQRATCCLLIAAAFAHCGCVRRRLTVRSNPAGARGYVDNQQIGITPFSTEFTYYGTRKIRLEQDGFESAEVERRFSTPWYQWPVIEFFSENVWPWELRDEREVVIDMKQRENRSPQQLVARAGSLRANVRRGVAVPIAAEPRRVPEVLPLPPAPRLPATQTFPFPGRPYTGPPHPVSPSYRPPNEGLLPPSGLPR
ncbi:MAG: PEGA domain-containing protein, partial [Pirellulaceae bacterium]|nr:PEGA domain-containing protein [Pirellulaceae bacterium]